MSSSAEHISLFAVEILVHIHIGKQTGTGVANWQVHVRVQRGRDEIVALSMSKKEASTAG